MPDKITNEQAIKILSDPLVDRHYHFSPDFADAIQRGIKALYYVESVSKFPHLIDHIPLPSQTID